MQTKDETDAKPAKRRVQISPKAETALRCAAMAGDHNAAVLLRLARIVVSELPGPWPSERAAVDEALVVGQSYKVRAGVLYAESTEDR